MKLYFAYVVLITVHDINCAVIVVTNFHLYSYDVMKQCWNADKTDRPLFTTLHETLQDYSTSEDLTNLISLQNIDSQSSYYQPRRHQSVRGIGGERLERRQHGEDGLQSGEERRQREEGGELMMADISSGRNYETELSSIVIIITLRDGLGRRKLVRIVQPVLSEICDYRLLSVN